MDARAYVVNVDCAVVRDGDYLLIERGRDETHAPGLLGFPGGTIEQSPGGDDTFERTAVREVREEVGVEVRDVEYVLSATFEADGGTPCLNVVTTGRHESGEAHSRAADEVAAVHWLPSEAIAEREDVPAFTRQYVERVEAFRAA